MDCKTTLQPQSTAGPGAAIGLHYMMMSGSHSPQSCSTESSSSSSKNSSLVISTSSPGGANNCPTAGCPSMYAMSPTDISAFYHQHHHQHHLQQASNNNNTQEFSPGPYAASTDLLMTSASPKESTTGQPQAPPQRIVTDDIPVLESFEGFYGFELMQPVTEEQSHAQVADSLLAASSSTPQTAATAASSAATSSKVNSTSYYFKDDNGWINLFARIAPDLWTLAYKCREPPPSDCFIRLVPVYGASDKQQEVIQRCFRDFERFPCSGLARYSVLKVCHSQAEYFFQAQTRRLCVTFPYERPKEGWEFSQFNGKFMCFNSCFNGGQGNKKPLYLMITLERARNQAETEVLGRQCIKFRSCACPKRDKENVSKRVFPDQQQQFLPSTPNMLASKRRKQNVAGAGWQQTDEIDFYENNSHQSSSDPTAMSNVRMLAVPQNIPSAWETLMHVRNLLVLLRTGGETRDGEHVIGNLTKLEHFANRCLTTEHQSQPDDMLVALTNGAAMNDHTMDATRPLIPSSFLFGSFPSQDSGFNSPTMLSGGSSTTSNSSSSELKGFLSNNPQPPPPPSHLNQSALYASPFRID